MKVLMLLVWGLVSVSSVLSGPQGAPRATEDEVRFLLWTKSNSGDAAYYELAIESAISLAASPLNPNDPTVVLVHGFSARGDDGWPVAAKTELLKAGSYNVISVDWRTLCNAPFYPEAVSNVPLVGAHTAKFLDWLRTDAGLDVSQLQLTGHSLGAHVSGAVGQNVNFNVPLITGMDPAGPEFYANPTSARLDPSDAQFVQVIHTNGGTILESCVGLEDACGHVDFYPNGGKHQPGCTIDGGNDWIDLLVGGCSHGRSHEYWVESINGSPTFYSYPCADWTTFESGGCSACGQGCQEMGFHVDTGLTGLYFLSTRAIPPYAQG